jgi:hypothetical protein
MESKVALAADIEQDMLPGDASNVYSQLKDEFKHDADETNLAKIIR